MPPTRTRQTGLYAYSWHGRGPEGPVNYADYLRALATVPAVQRQTVVGEETVAVTLMEAIGTRWALRFVSGREGLPPLFYDPETGEESREDIGTRFVASSSWAFIDAGRRLAAIERRRPGVSANTMARAMSHLGRELLNYEQLTMSLNPVTSKTFLDELQRFERVRQAAVVVSRPNYDWTDNATSLTQYAAESEAGKAEVAMSAERGASLSKESGIVRDIENLTRQPIGPLHNLRVTGTRQGDSRETTLSLTRHQERRFVALPQVSTPFEERTALEASGLAMLDGIESESADNEA